MPRYWRFWRFVRYSWGWDFGPFFGWWLVWSRCNDPKRPRLYVSNDATPPDTAHARGFFLIR